MFSVNFATTIHHLFRKGHVSEPLGKSTYSTIIQSSMIANTHRIHMSKTFQPDTQTDRAYNFASQRIHLKGDVNNNNSCYPYSTGHMCLDLSSPHDACQKRKIKKENFDSSHKSKYRKVKDRPFAEGSRGCHALICLYAQSLSAKEHHIILPLMIATFIMQSIAFIILPSQVRTTLDFLLH